MSNYLGLACQGGTIHGDFKLHLPPEMEALVGAMPPMHNQGACPASTSRQMSKRDLSDLLLARVYMISDSLLQHDTAIHNLQVEMKAAPPEVQVFSDENTMLARHSQEVLAEVSEICAVNGALEHEVSQCQQQVKDLQIERDKLLVQLRVTEDLYYKSREVSDRAVRALDVERHRDEEWLQRLEAARLQQNRHVAEAEERAAVATRELTRLKATNAVVNAKVATEAQVAIADAAKLQANLGELLDQRRAEVVHQREVSQEVSQELLEVRAERLKLETETKLMAEQLAGSENRVEETERKAFSVARELVDTSHSIARLRCEVAMQPVLRSELEEAQREEGLLQQRWDAVQREISHCFHEDSFTSKRLTTVDEDSSLTLTPAKNELRHLRVSQERAINEALRTAWETEARDRRATETKLETLQASWLPLRECLLRLTTGAHRWREEFVAHCPNKTLPIIVPLSSTECNDAHPADAARALCDCLEALALEGAGRRTSVAAAWNGGWGQFQST